jgi:hypothetical protein
MYIGKTPTVGNFQVCDAISVVNGQAAYTLQVGGTNVAPESANHMLVSLNGILQKPGSSFTISGSTMTFASNLATGDVIDFVQILGNVLDIGQPSDDTVTAAKLNNDIISGQTALTSEPADTDEFLVSDAGTIKRIDYSLIKGAGKVLQIVSGEDSTERSTSSDTFQDIEAVNITPSATSSKVLVIAHISGIRRDSSSGYMSARVTDGSSFTKKFGHAMLFTGGSSSLRIGSAGGSFLHSPSTTSQKTYTLQFNSASGSGGVVVGDNNDCISSLTLMEIAG